MTKALKKEYTLVGFEKSKSKNKMYTAVIKNKKTGRTRKINFGHSGMENYRDTTGLNAYPNLIHGDAIRRKAFKSRFRKTFEKNRLYYTPMFFSWKYLW